MSHQPLKSAGRECRLTKGSLCARHPECILLAPGGPSPDSAQRCGDTGPAEACPPAGGLAFLQSGWPAPGAPTFCCAVCPAAIEHPQTPGESPGGSEPMHSIPRMLSGEGWPLKGLLGSCSPSELSAHRARWGDDARSWWTLLTGAPRYLLLPYTEMPVTWWAC